MKREIIITVTGPMEYMDHICDKLSGILPPDDRGRRPTVLIDKKALHGIDGQGDVVCAAYARATYPDPTPDLPALIRAWHAEPSTANRKALWQALANSDNGGWAFEPYTFDGVKYSARSDGSISIL